MDPDWVDVFPIKHGDVIPASYVIVYHWSSFEFSGILRSGFLANRKAFDTPIPWQVSSN